jgi:hypothetical protein
MKLFIVQFLYRPHMSSLSGPYLLQILNLEHPKHPVFSLI